MVRQRPRLERARVGAAFSFRRPLHVLLRISRRVGAAWTDTAAWLGRPGTTGSLRRDRTDLSLRVRWKCGFGQPQRDRQTAQEDQRQEDEVHGGAGLRGDALLRTRASTATRRGFTRRLLPIRRRPHPR